MSSFRLTKIFDVRYAKTYNSVHVREGEEGETILSDDQNRHKQLS